MCLSIIMIYFIYPHWYYIGFLKISFNKKLKFGTKAKHHTERSGTAFWNDKYGCVTICHLLSCIFLNMCSSLLLHILDRNCVYIKVKMLILIQTCKLKLFYIRIQNSLQNGKWWFLNGYARKKMSECVFNLFYFIVLWIIHSNYIWYIGMFLNYSWYV